LDGKFASNIDYEKQQAMSVLQRLVMMLHNYGSEDLAKKLEDRFKKLESRYQANTPGAGSQKLFQ
jgi:hypothetical protein